MKCFLHCCEHLLGAAKEAGGGQAKNSLLDMFDLTLQLVKVQGSCCLASAWLDELWWPDISFCKLWNACWIAKTAFLLLFSFNPQLMPVQLVLLPLVPRFGFCIAAIDSSLSFGKTMSSWSMHSVLLWSWDESKTPWQQQFLQQQHSCCTSCKSAVKTRRFETDTLCIQTTPLSFLAMTSCHAHAHDWPSIPPNKILMFEATIFVKQRHHPTNSYQKSSDGGSAKLEFWCIARSHQWVEMSIGLTTLQEKNSTFFCFVSCLVSNQQHCLRCCQGNISLKQQDLSNSISSATHWHCVQVHNDSLGLWTATIHRKLNQTDLNRFVQFRSMTVNDSMHALSPDQLVNNFGLLDSNCVIRAGDWDILTTVLDAIFEVLAILFKLIN